MLPKSYPVCFQKLPGYSQLRDLALPLLPWGELWLLWGNAGTQDSRSYCTVVTKVEPKNVAGPSRVTDTKCMKLFGSSSLVPRE